MRKFAIAVVMERNMSVGDEAEHLRTKDSGLADVPNTRPVWKAPCLQTLSLAETRNGGTSTSDGTPSFSFRDGS